MEHVLRKVRELIPFKDSTNVGDIVLVISQEPDNLYYAFVSNIERDTSRKDEWWHVSMQILTFPIQNITWTLRSPQFTGQETFTMGGVPHFIQAVQLQSTVPKAPSIKKGGLRIVK